MAMNFDIKNIESRALFQSLTSPNYHYLVREKIGSGTFGRVYRGIYVETGIDVAIKIIPLSREHIDRQIQEIKILSKAEHQNIIRFYGAFYDSTSEISPDLWIVTELCSGGSMRNMIDDYSKKNKFISNDIFRYSMMQTLEALFYLHHNNIMHRDLKSSNILIDKYASVKIADFGSSCYFTGENERFRMIIGSPYWMAPEMLLCQFNKNASYTYKCDIWSLGITMLEIVDGHPPNYNLPPKEVFKMFLDSETVKNLPSSERPEKLKDLIHKCLTINHMKRPSAESLIKHSFFGGYGNSVWKVKNKIISILNKRK